MIDKLRTLLRLESVSGRNTNNFVTIIYRVILFAILLFPLTETAFGQTPGQNATIERKTVEPTQYSDITFEFSGVWPNACVPQPPQPSLTKISTAEKTITIDMNLPSLGCTAVNTPWRYTLTVPAPIQNPDPNDLTTENWKIRVIGTAPGKVDQLLGEAPFDIVKTPPVATVSAATYGGEKFGKGSIVSMWGDRLATMTDQSRSLPLATSLAGTTVQITDAGKQVFTAQLYFVSLNQLNVLLPKTANVGKATLRVTNSKGGVSIGTFDIAERSLTLFSADSTGTGMPAGYFQRFRGSQQIGSNEDAAMRDEADRLETRPLSVVQDDSLDVFLILYGTGVSTALTPGEIASNFSARIGTIELEYFAPRVDYVGPAPDLLGVTQINLRLPKEVLVQGEVYVNLLLDSILATKNSDTLKVCTGCTYATDPANRALSFKEGSASLKVQTQPGCRWQLNSPAWIRPQNVGGIQVGAKTVNYSYVHNPEFAGRTGDINVLIEAANRKYEQIATRQPHIQGGLVCDYGFPQPVIVSTTTDEQVVSKTLVTNIEDSNQRCRGVVEVRSIRGVSGFTEVIEPPSNGYKRGDTVRFRVKQNERAEQNSADILIKDTATSISKNIFEINQNAAPCSYKARINSQDIPNGGVNIPAEGWDPFVLSISSNGPSCDSTVANTSLITFTSPFRKIGENTEFTGRVTRNRDGGVDNADKRAGEIRVTHDVGISTIIPFNQQGFPCVVKLDRGQITGLDWQGATIPYTVTTNGSNCNWTIKATDKDVNNNPFILPVSISGGGRSSPIVFTLEDNPLKTARFGMIRVDSSVGCNNSSDPITCSTIEQIGLPCKYEFAPTMKTVTHIPLNLDHPDYETTLTVPGLTCTDNTSPITVSPLSPWLKYNAIQYDAVASAKFSYKYKVFYSVMDNNFSGAIKRTGELLIAGNPYTVTQVSACNETDQKLTIAVPSPLPDGFRGVPGVVDLVKNEITITYDPEGTKNTFDYLEVLTTMCGWKAEVFYPEGTPKDEFGNSIEWLSLIEGNFALNKQLVEWGGKKITRDNDGQYSDGGLKFRVDEFDKPKCKTDCPIDIRTAHILVKGTKGVLTDQTLFTIIVKQTKVK